MSLVFASTQYKRGAGPDTATIQKAPVDSREPNPSRDQLPCPPAVSESDPGPTTNGPGPAPDAGQRPSDARQPREAPVLNGTYDKRDDASSDVPSTSAATPPMAGGEVTPPVMTHPATTATPQSGPMPAGFAPSVGLSTIMAYPQGQPPTVYPVADYMMQRRQLPPGAAPYQQPPGSLQQQQPRVPHVQPYPYAVPPHPSSGPPRPQQNSRYQVPDGYPNPSSQGCYLPSQSQG